LVVGRFVVVSIVGIFVVCCVDMGRRTRGKALVVADGDLDGSIV
jgi:hypothetical protein